MSSPNSVGIDPASANEDVFKAGGRLVYQLGRFSTNCNKVILLKRTSQLIVPQTEALQVDALEQLARNCACQRMLSHKVRRGRHKVRRGRLVLPHLVK